MFIHSCSLRLFTMPAIETKISRDRALHLVSTALESAQRVVKNLGDAGRKVSGTNAHGQEMLRADWDCEEAVIAELRGKLPAQIRAEEHGIVNLVENPRVAVLLDGLDGSSVFLGKFPELYEQRNIPRHFSTMVAIFDRVNPTFGDYVACGWIDHATDTMYFATKGGGAFAKNNGIIRTLSCASELKFNPQTLIYLERYFPELDRDFSPALQGCNVDCLFAGNAYLIDLVDPEVPRHRRAGGVIHCSAKMGLECAIAYGLVREAGGVITDGTGKDLENVHYVDFVSGPIKPYIAAASRQFAQDLVKHCTQISREGSEAKR